MRVPCCLLFLAAAAFQAAVARHCPDTEYWSEAELDCVPCSECGHFEFVAVVCQPRRDTQCASCDGTPLHFNEDYGRKCGSARFRNIIESHLRETLERQFALKDAPAHEADPDEVIQIERKHFGSQNRAAGPGMKQSEEDDADTLIEDIARGREELRQKETARNSFGDYNRAGGAAERTEKSEEDEADTLIEDIVRGREELRQQDAEGIAESAEDFSDDDTGEKEKVHWVLLQKRNAKDKKVEVARLESIEREQEMQEILPADVIGDEDEDDVDEDDEDEDAAVEEELEAPQDLEPFETELDKHLKKLKMRNQLRFPFPAIRRIVKTEVESNADSTDEESELIGFEEFEMNQDPYAELELLNRRRGSPEFAERVQDPLFNLEEEKEKMRAVDGSDSVEVDEDDKVDPAVERQMEGIEITRDRYIAILQLDNHRPTRDQADGQNHGSHIRPYIWLAFAAICLALCVKGVLHSRVQLRTLQYSVDNLRCLTAQEREVIERAARLLEKNEAHVYENKLHDMA